MNPLVSIIMPAYNVESFIGDAIESVLLQSYQNWELIIVDNESRDQTLATIQSFRDSRIRIFSEQKQGASGARNKALDESKGQLICFLDADDRLPVESLEVRVLALLDNNKLSFIDGIVRFYGDDFSALLRSWTPDFMGNPYKEMALLNPRCFSGITWMIRKSSIQDLRFDESWTHLEDRMFFLKASALGLYSFVNSNTYDVRKRPGSLMTDHAALDASYHRFLGYVHEQKILDVQTESKERMRYHRMFFRTHLKHFRPWQTFKHLYFFFRNFIR